MGKKLYIILVLTLLVAGSCSKDDAVSRIVTIDNTRTLGTTYYVYGFHFSTGKKVSTIGLPKPDITVDSDGTDVFFMADNRRNSFFKVGKYSDEAGARNAFDNLKSATVPPDSWEGMAYPLEENQVWIYRADNDTYAKLRIISIVSEKRSNVDYAECTFEWEYQPDGTLTFPGK